MRWLRSKTAREDRLTLLINNLALARRRLC
jgi:hypothetical protein